LTTGRPFYIGSFQSDLLDLSRWVAAGLVVVEHLRSLLFADYGSLGRPGMATKVFYFITGFGHSAVMIFFVMSGFLVGGKVLERMAQGSFSWQKYFVDRTSRLYAVYLLALLLGAALDHLGYHHFNRFGLYDDTFPGQIAVINHSFYQNLTLPVFILNLGMCQTILGPVFGSNGPLWSLANEFWYYLAGPLLFAIVLSRSAGFRISGGITLAAICIFLPASILIYGVVWLLGAGLYYANHRRLLPLWVALPLFLGSFGLARLQWLSVPYLADCLIGITFALLINATAGEIRRIPGHVWHKRMADFSYSVYLCHFPFLIFVISVMLQKDWIGFRGVPTMLLSSVFLMVLVLTYIGCYLVSLVTERRTRQIRSWLNRQFIVLSKGD